LKSKISRRLIADTNQFKDTLNTLKQLTDQISHEDFSRIIEELQERVTTPFTFVIVGEVKAGKSSFVNALLDANKEVCKVAASPMTDTIQQILHSENEETVLVNEVFKKIYLDVEILKEISIVDTPGTNTIVDHHQEITERFIPFSDLIVFVFESKNPYRQSAWEFFDYINAEWRRKIIFVLQQKDLMEPDDLVTNINGVTKHALEKGIQDPKVFAVSAKQELNGDKENSGFIELREYLNNNITGGQAPKLKLENNVETAQNINSQIEKNIAIRSKQYQADLNFRKEIKSELQDQSERSFAQARSLVDVLSAAYQRITNEKIEKINEELSFGKVLKRSFRAIMTSEVSLKEWLGKEAKDLEHELNIELKDKLNTGIVDLADQIQNMVRMIDMKIKTSETILTDNNELFAEVAKERSSILKDLQNSFKDFVQKSENFYDENTKDSTGSLAPNLAAGGGIAVIGVILTAVTNGAVFDITGGILTTIGVLFAGVSLGWQKNKLTRSFRKEIKSGRVKLEKEVQEKLNNYITAIKSKIEDIFQDLDNYLNNENAVLSEFESLNKKVDKELKKLKS
jgi:GTPase SAR1 family protein